MKPLMLILITFLLLVEASYAQDTTYIDKKIEYFSSKEKSNSSERYAREIIKVGKDSFKIEYCNYYNGKRNATGYTEGFKIKDDSILIIKNESWSFRKICNNVYAVNLRDSEYVQKGIAYSIIPFVKNGNFIYLNNVNDTLLTEHYEMGSLKDYKTPKIKNTDTIYTSVDEDPIFPIKYGNLREYISRRIILPEIYADAGIQGRTIFRTVITSTGEVKNIEIFRSLDRAFDLTCLRIIARLPKFEPGKIKGKNVNSYYIIPVAFRLE
jgi:hypothetical protein